jgi:hypothetical protein
MMSASRGARAGDDLERVAVDLAGLRLRNADRDVEVATSIVRPALAPVSNVTPP